MRALIKGHDGYRYRGTVGDDLIFTSKPDYRVTEAADIVVDAELAEATDAANTVAMALAIVPRNGDDTPFDDVNLGDTARAADLDATHGRNRIVSLPTREDRLGNVQYGLELNSRIENEQAEKRRWLEQITPGALSGRADQISATSLGVAIPFGKLRSSSITYQQTGELVAELDYEDPEDQGHSDDWPVDEPILFHRVRWSLQQAGDTDTVVHLRLNGGGGFDTGSPDFVPFFHAITIPAGATAPDDDTNLGMYTNQVAFKGDLVRIATYQAGDYARGLVVRLFYTSQT